MKREQVISKSNLTLAWRRINAGFNVQHKRFFRSAYLNYESALDENISVLHDELKGGDWKPSHATKIYVPKPSGLQRPLSLLKIEDQILLQAITNIFANNLRQKRAKVEKRSVFSNFLAKDKKSVFFTERWQESYYHFQNVCKRYFSEKNIAGWLISILQRIMTRSLTTYYGLLLMGEIRTEN